MLRSFINKVFIATISCIFLLSCLTIYAGQPSIRIQAETRPTISRFSGFTGIVEQSTLGRIDPGSFRLYVNGENHTQYLRRSTDPSTGNVILAYKPIKALNDGKNRFKLLLATMDGKQIERSWNITVSPGRDPSLAPFVNATRKDPRNPDPHFQLAKGYEKKFLMEDAQEEFKRVLEINPKHEEAKQAYDRIFASWGRKAIAKRGVIIDVEIEEGLIAMGGPLIFKVIVENNSNNNVTISKNDIFLLDSQGNQLLPLEKLEEYPGTALDQGWINLEEYAKLSYRLEVQPYSLFNNYKLSTKITSSGFFAFSLSSREAKRIILTFAKVTIGSKSSSFSFPFTRS